MVFSEQIRRGFLKRFWVALGVVSLCTVGGVVAADTVFGSYLNDIKRVNVQLDKEVGSAKPANYLLVGSDSRAFVDDPTDAAEFGASNQVSGQRSDTIIVMHVDPAQKKTLLVSFPRDLWVNIPGVGMSKINAAYNQGPDKLIETIRSNFNIPINHYLEVGFSSFQGIVDAIGHVPVYFPAPARDTYTGLDISAAGCAQLDGKEALSYVRSRHYQELVNGRWQSDPTADLGRIKRQQDFMRRLASQAVHEGLNNPSTAIKVAGKVTSKLKADQKFGKNDILRFLNSFGNVDPNDPNHLEMTTVPNRPPSPGEVRTGGQAVLVLRQPDADQVFARLREFGPEPGTQAASKTVAPSSIRVRVLNGTGVSGAAADALQNLQSQGFNPAGTGNNARVQTTKVEYLPSAKDKAAVVASYLGGTGQLVENPNIIDADVVVVVGADFKGVSVPSKGATTTTQAATTTTAKKSSGKSNTTQAPTTTTPGGCT